MFTNFRDSSSYTKASGYPKLTEVTLPSSLKSIGSYAFYKAPQLSEVVLPNSLQYIGAGAFAGSALKKLVLPAGTASSPVTFSNIKTLEEVVIEGGAIGDRAFADCSSLKKVTLKEGVTSIGIMAFDNCRSLTSFEIPDSVTSISALMLRGCKNITYLKVGGGIADLSLDSPSLNTDMTNYTIIEEDGSSHYGTVGFNPFYIGYGSMLRTIVISEGVTDIGREPLVESGGAGSREASTRYVSHPRGGRQGVYRWRGREGESPPGGRVVLSARYDVRRLCVP